MLSFISSVLSAFRLFTRMVGLLNYYNLSPPPVLPITLSVKVWTAVVSIMHNSRSYLSEALENVAHTFAENPF